VKASYLLVFVSLFLVVFLPDASAVNRRIRVVCMGDVIDQYGGFNSFVVIRTDPAIDTTLVPSRPSYLGFDRARRNMRIYMPRTYSQLKENYDLIVMSDADRTVFDATWVEWMSRGVKEGGLGLLWLGSIASNSFPSWEGTTITQVLPSEPSPELDISGSFKVRIHDRGEPLMRILAWEDSPPLANLNTQIPRDAARVFALTDSPKGYPLITYWEIGSGRALCFASKFPNGVAPWARDWQYFPEAMIFLAYRTGDRPLPDDVSLFSQLISDFGDFEMRNSMVVSVINFVEQFGGRTDKLYRRLDELGLKKKAAETAYLAGDYASSLEKMKEIRGGQQALMRDAMEVKDSAMFWVYLTEWCAITAAILISGVVLWGLMVRRRLYREVYTSRLGQT